MIDIAALIERSDYFRGVSSQNRELLTDICIPKELSKKETLFSEGEKGFAFYLLASGAIKLYKSSEKGKEVVIKIIHPGEPFAEVILFERDVYPVTAVAMRPGVVLIIPKKQFYGLLAIENFRNDFIAMLMRKQRYLTERIHFLTMNDVEERFFLFLKEQFGDTSKITLNLSKKDIASAIGATPETYSRLVARLEKENKIKIQGKVIVLSGNKMD